MTAITGGMRQSGAAAKFSGASRPPDRRNKSYNKKGKLIFDKPAENAIFRNTRSAGIGRFALFHFPADKSPPLYGQIAAGVIQ